MDCFDSALATVAGQLWTLIAQHERQTDTNINVYTGGKYLENVPYLQTIFVFKLVILGHSNGVFVDYK